MNIKKDYHKTDIHQRMLRNIALNIELLKNDKDKDMSEYDIQAFMALFLKRNLINTGYHLHRESFGKYDCVIAREGKEKPEILYEIKTFVKPKEHLQTITSWKKIEKDFKKLKKGKEKYTNCRAYFILVCKGRDLEDMIEEFDFLKQRIESKSKKHIKMDGYKFRKSSKSNIDKRTFVFSWEVL
jgi:hypothetical protein